ncbi:hypothetical protein [Tenacibaculum xiamenense]|uniref:hypothetical protein n=1 Tax=Tenacibaculum xiamenense TaxID=1261553 RepID=UPI003893F58A
MKNLLLTATLLFAIHTFSQTQKGHPFFTGSISTTFGINQDHEWFDGNDDETFIEPKSVLIRTGIGYQFDKRWASSVNIGYDHHFSYAINSIPMYGSLRYNFVVNDSDAWFIEGSYGQMFRPSKRFSNGNYYKVGIGILGLSDNRWNGIVRIDFHRKKIAGFRNGNLDSVSLGIGFSFF